MVMPLCEGKHGSERIPLDDEVGTGKQVWPYAQR